MDLDSALTGKPAEGASATELLRADHGEVARLFDEYEAARGAGHTRDVVAQTIAMQLELHDTIESEIFYPAIQDHASELVEAALEAHAEIAGLVEEVDDAEDDEGRDDLVSRLRSAVEAHVRAEEGDLFARVESLGADTLRDLGRAMIKRKEELTRSTESFENPAT